MTPTVLIKQIVIPRRGSGAFFYCILCSSATGYYEEWDGGLVLLSEVKRGDELGLYNGESHCDSTDNSGVSQEQLRWRQWDGIKVAKYFCPCAPVYCKKPWATRPVELKFRCKPSFCFHRTREYCNSGMMARK